MEQRIQFAIYELVDLAGRRAFRIDDVIVPVPPNEEGKSDEDLLVEWSAESGRKSLSVSDLKCNEAWAQIEAVGDLLGLQDSLGPQFRAGFEQLIALLFEAAKGNTPGWMFEDICSNHLDRDEYRRITERNQR